MKRKKSQLKAPKRKKYKYSLTQEIIDNGGGVPVHYIFDRLVSKKKVDEMYRKIYLRNNIFDNLPSDVTFMMESLCSEDYNKFKTYVFDLIEDGFDKNFIYEEIDEWFDLI